MGSRGDPAIRVGMGLGVAWGLFVIAAILRFKREALGLLIGLPLALWWPLFAGMMAVQCAHNARGCLP